MGDSLYLRGTPIASLPEGLTVGGSLDLRGTQITALPEGLTVGDSLYLRGTPIASLPEGLTVGGSLDLRGTQITALPEGLTVGGWLDLEGTPIASLPEGLTVGDSLYLRGTPIASLPEGLTVGGSLDLRGTQITALPEGLTVGGWLDLEGTPIASLPEGLTVGGSLDLEGTPIASTERTKVKRLQNGDYVPGKYLYADDILTHVIKCRKVREYTLYIGKIPGHNVVSDGTYYAHCETLRDGIADIAFKRASDRGADQYKGIDLDTEFTLEDAKTMYRVITGACQAGTEQFVESLGEKLKAKYTVREMIEVTKWQYGSERFAEFFGGDNDD